MQRMLQRLPFLLILQGLGAVSMVVPAIHAMHLGHWAIARSFLFSALVFAVLFVLLAVAFGNRGRDGAVRGQLLGLVGALLLLPVMLAIPMRESVPDMGLFAAWFEMVSSLTTTGASLFPEPDNISPTLHLWRALVAWMGGLLFWVSALAILAPLNLGGFEVIATDITAAGRAALRERRAGRPGERLRRYAIRLMPIYGGLTMLLWLLLVMLGAEPTAGVILAMSTMSTSGIVPGGFQTGTIAIEVPICIFLVFALSRLTFRNDFITRERGVLLRDPEIRLSLTLLVLVPGFLFLRHFLGSIEIDAEEDVPAAIRALWGAFFTTLSFLTTTGFESAGYEDARFWSGLPTPGILLVGLSLVGGGVATTAGGVKLLRIYALYKHGAREMGRLVHPNSIGGSGAAGRRLRREGAFVAWIFFMLFAITIAATMLALSLTGLPFEKSVILAVAALSTTGPLAEVAGEAPIPYLDLGMPVQAILAAVMVIGRLEALALIALFNRDFWRN